MKIDVKVFDGMDHRLLFSDLDVKELDDIIPLLVRWGISGVSGETLDPEAMFGQFRLADNRAFFEITDA